MIVDSKSLKNYTFLYLLLLLFIISLYLGTYKLRDDSRDNDAGFRNDCSCKTL